jgi:NADPH:quinone reductase-like Zn-dependent oxidoreductase
MKAAIVKEAGATPVYSNFPDPAPTEGEHVVSVVAAALSPLTRGRAAGTHYSSSHVFPFVVGVDGVGRLDDGRRVYFVLPRAPYGAMAERCPTPASRCIAIPDDLDDVAAAAIANPGMSAWAAFAERAKLAAGETVLINGATGSAGHVAIQIAKYLGAGKIIATGRNVETLNSLAALGADVTIPLVEDAEALEEAFIEQFAAGVDVVADYLWGPSAERLLIAQAKADKGKRVRFVQIGSASSPTIELPSAALRSTPIELMGSGIGSVPTDRLLAAIGNVLQAAVTGGFKLATRAVPLSQVERTWPTRDDGARVVFTFDSARP